MREFIDKITKRFVRVEVIEPVTITTKEHIGWSSSFTTYLIKIKTNHWAFSLHESEVRRRFSDFCWLRSKLVYHHPNKIVPPLPPKKFFHITKFDPKVIEERCQGLEKFIQRLLRSFVFLSDAAFHLFLQSDLSIMEIEDKLNEEIKPNYKTKRLHLHYNHNQQNQQPPIYNRSTSTSSAESNQSTTGVSDIDESERGSNDYLELDNTNEETNDYEQLHGHGENSPRFEVVYPEINTKEFDFSE